MDFWKELKYFKRSEFPEPEKMDETLMRNLDALRGYLGVSIIITYSTNGSHSKKTQHTEGFAVDVVVPNFKGSIFSLYLVVERFNFTGIGVYPNWKYKGKMIGGLHLDNRILETVYTQGARWLGVPEYSNRIGKIKNAYYPLNTVNLIKYKLLTKVEE